MTDLRVCILCKHWRCEAYPGYSEYTPGESWYMECTYGYYSVNGYTVDSEEAFREYILKANNCKDYVQISGEK